MKLGSISRKHLIDVHPDLVRVIEHAITQTTVDFRVTEGLRTLERQRQLVKAGASHTLNSRHLTGHAVDLVALIDGKVRWDWPLYDCIAVAVLGAADTLDIPVEWGGHWTRFKDGPHYQLARKRYPSRD